jgi:tetratricopeptide (TPR) repeat protein
VYVNTPHSSSEAYRLGIRAFGRQDWKNALIYLKQVAGLEPGAPDVWFLIGETYRQQGDLPQALQTFNQVIKDKPDFAPAYLGRARVTIAMNPKNVDAALADMQTAIQKDPKFGEAYLGIVAVYLQTGDVEQALTILDQAANLMPNSPAVFLSRAQAYLALKDTKQALQNARRANELDITLLPAYRLIGQVLQIEGDLAGSLTPLNTYLMYKPDDAQAWAWLANAYLDGKDTQAALKALEQSLRLDTHQNDAYLLRAQLLFDSGKTERALDDYRAALRLDPTSYAAGLGIGQALMVMDYPGDAYVQFERTRSLAEGDLQKAELIFWRAQSLEKLGQLDVAQRDFQALIAMPSSSVQDEWVKYAQNRLAAIARLTPSPKPKSPTPTVTVTYTRQPTRTKTPTATRPPAKTAVQASATPTR